MSEIDVFFYSVGGVSLIRAYGPVWLKKVTLFTSLLV